MNWLNDLLKRNWVAKIVSVLAAAILWIFVMNEQNPFLEKSVSVPIVAENPPESYQIVFSKDKAKLKLRGKRSAFLAAGRTEYRTIVDLAGLGEGEHEVELESNIPVGIEIASMRPEKITVGLEKIIKRTVPVELVVTDTVAEGSVLNSMLPDSRAVEVMGPRRAVEKVKKVIATVPLSDSSSSFTIEVALKAVDDKRQTVENVTLFKKNMMVKVQVSKGTAQKIVPIKPVFMSDLPAGYSFNGAVIVPETVALEGPAATLASIKEMVTVPISLADMTKPFKRIVKLRLPNEVVTSVTEVSVEVNIAGKE